MITNLLPRFTVVILIYSLMILGGCATTEPSRFYLLHPMASPEQEAQVTKEEDGVTIVVGPVELPEYLDRPQIVTRVSKNELKLAEFDQWAESLNPNILRVLAENLSILLSTDWIFMYPWTRSSKIDYQIELLVTRFDGTLGDSVVLDALWAILKGDSREVLLTSKSTLKQPTGGQDYGALVSAKSQALANLSREIADAIRSLSKSKTD